MDFKTLNELATWMLSNIRLSRYDDQFVNNLTLYITQHNRITSNQDLLFRKVAGKYKRQFSQLKIEIEEVLTRSWDVNIVESIPEYTGASIKIENDKLILRSPFNKNFLTALKKKPIYSLQWIKDRRQYEGEYSHTNLKELMYLTADHYSILNYCEQVTQIIESLSVFENIKYWTPTLVYKGHYYIAAMNEHLYEVIKDIPINDDLKTISTLVKYGIAIDQSVTDHLLETEIPAKVRLAINFQVEIELRDTQLAIEWLEEFGCDAICEPKAFLTNSKLNIHNTTINVFANPKDLKNYENSVIVYQRGNFSLVNETPMKLFKIIKFVNSEPIDLGPK
jgi:hypothetical protein